MEDTMDGQSSMQDNALSLIRIMAAFQVMFGHMLEHLDLPIDSTLYGITYYFRGVPIFFALSGFLIWFSIGRSKSYGIYLKKRFLRIYPELWVALLIEIIILVILYHGWEIKSLLLFVFAQGTIFQFWTPSSLRGYGVGTPNGALWTIGVMIQFYVIAWFVYKLFKGKNNRVWIMGLIISFAVSWVLGMAFDHIGIEIVSKLYSQTIIKYFWLFYIGAFIAEFKEKMLPMFQKYWWVLLIIAAVFFWIQFDIYSGYHLFWSTFLIAGLIGFAYRFPQLQLETDISYGIFLYHMTAVNAFVIFGWIKNWVWAALCICITVGLAWVSTMTIGVWVTKHKNGV